MQCMLLKITLNFQERKKKECRMIIKETPPTFNIRKFKCNNITFYYIIK